MTRRHQRWAATGFICAIGAVAVGMYYYGGMSQRFLMFGWMGPMLAVLYALGLNVWAGGPFDPDDDAAHEERRRGAE